MQAKLHAMDECPPPEAPASPNHKHPASVGQRDQEPTGAGLLIVCNFPSAMDFTSERKQRLSAL